jgi:NADH-quinone oxidoreductase subunit G
MLVIGQGALARSDGAAVLNTARRIAEATGMNADTWNGFNVLHTAAARVGALDLGFVPGEQGRDVDGILSGAESGDIKVVFLMGADELDTRRLDKSFVVYQGHHGDVGAHAADVILPGSAYTEKAGTWVNTEGRVQHAEAATQPPGDAREDWTILRALSEVLGHTLPFDTFGALQTAMIDACPILGLVDEQTSGNWGAFGAEGTLGTDIFESAVENFYMTDPISRASPTMAECTSVFAGEKTDKTGTDG